MSELALRVWGPLLLAAPALAFPLTVPAFSIACLAGAVVWMGVIAWRRRGSAPRLPLLDSPLHAPLLLLFVMTLVGAARSEYLALTVPKLAGLAMGLLVLNGILWTGTNGERIWMLGRAYVLLGLATLAIAFLAGPSWKGLGAGLLYDLAHATVPQVLSLPGAEQGINPNALGGTTLLFLPVLTALAFCRPPSGGGGRPPDVHRGVDLAERALYGVCALGVAVILLLSQSRTSWGSGMLAVLAVLAIRFRWMAKLSVIAAGVVVVTAWWMGPGEALQAVLFKLKPLIGFLDNGDRGVIWRFGLAAVFDHPWTGVGLGTFREVIHSLTVDGRVYALPVPHAHNIFLQVALDVGIPGLVAYLAALGLVTFMAWQVYQRADDSRLKSLALGIWGNVFAIHLFGLTDAIALGAKVGLFWWFGIGLLAAGHRVVMRGTHRSGSARGRADSVR